MHTSCPLHNRIEVVSSQAKLSADLSRWRYTLPNQLERSSIDTQWHGCCRPERVNLVQQAGRSQDGCRTTHLGLGKQSQLAASPVVQVLPRQAAAAECREERTLLAEAPTAGPAAAAAGAKAAAKTGQLALAPGGQPLQTPATISTGQLAVCCLAPYVLVAFLWLVAYRYPLPPVGS